MASKKTKFKDLPRIKEYRLRYVDWIDKREKHHHRVFLDVKKINNEKLTIAYFEFKTKKEAEKMQVLKSRRGEKNGWN